MDAVLKQLEWQDIRLDRLDRRIQQLEPAVRVLRRTVAEVKWAPKNGPGA